MDFDVSRPAGRNAFPRLPSRLALLTGLAAATLGTGAAFAADDPAPQTLAPVTVRGTGETATGPVAGYVARVDRAATKTDTPLIEAPQSITVIPRDQIDDQGAQTVGEALRYTAGVYSDARPGNRYDSMFLRGFGGFGGSANYVEYLDGLKLQRGLSYAVPSFDQTMLERIEVLRGPASVLYGQANPGGLINMTSKRPTADPLHEIVVGYGTDNQKFTSFDLGGALDADKTMLYRVTGVGRAGDGPIDHSKEERFAIAPSFTWKPNGETKVTILSSYQRDPKSYYAPFLPVYGTVLPNRNGQIARDFDPGDPNFDSYDRTQATAGYEIEHAVTDNVKLRQNLRFMHIDSEFRSLSVSALSANQAVLSRRSALVNERVNTLALDNQGEVKFQTGALAHTLLGGIDYQYGNAHRELGNGTAPSLSLLNPVYNLVIADPAVTSIATQKQQQLGFYAQDQMRFGNWAFLLGGRQDWARTETDFDKGGTDSSQNDHAFTWRTGLVYLFDNGLAPYVSYATSFQPQTGTDYAGHAFDPTEGKQYEAGVKFQPKGVNSFITASVYHLTQSNVLTTDTAHSGYSIATGEVTSKGVELEAHASLSQNLDLVASYAYTDITNTKSNNAAILDKRPAGAPKNIAALWAKYGFHEGPATGLGLGAGVRYVGESAADAANTTTVPSVTLVDASVSYDLDHVAPSLAGMRVQLNANNLFDRKYVAACSSATTCFYGSGRTVLATLRYRW